MLSSKADLTFGSKFLRAKSISDFSTFKDFGLTPSNFSQRFNNESSVAPGNKSKIGVIAAIALLTSKSPRGRSF